MVRTINFSHFELISNLKNELSLSDYYFVSVSGPNRK